MYITHCINIRRDCKILSFNVYYYVIILCSVMYDDTYASIYFEIEINIYLWEMLMDVWMM